MTHDFKYPIGNYAPADYSNDLKNKRLSDIKIFPMILKSTVEGMSEEQLQTPYREGGWTVHQLVHHIADSHMNAYIRFKLGYTEEKPTIKPYDEKVWATTADVRNLPVGISVNLLHSLHQRWHEFLLSFSDEDFKKTFFHPEHKKELTLWYLFGLYSWHGRHHTAHIQNLKKRMKW